MSYTADQVQTAETTEPTLETSTETPQTEVQGNQESSTSEQSSQDQSTEQTFSYTDSLGNKLSGEELGKNYETLQKKFTQTSQELAQLKRSFEETKKSVETQTRDQLSESPNLKDLPPEVRNDLVNMLSPVVTSILEGERQKEQQVREDQEFESLLTTLEGKYDGKNGLPKFDRQDILQAMADPANKIFDPEALYTTRHHAQIMDHAIKQAQKQQEGVSTEHTGNVPPAKPETPSPRSWDDAAKRAASRFS